MNYVRVRCDKCNQPLDEIEREDGYPEYKYHFDIQDCFKALIVRVDNLENELLAKRLQDSLSRSSEPGPPPSSKPVVIPAYPKIFKR